MGRPATDTQDIPLATRIFAVLAAVFLVASVALGTILPPDMSLHEALHTIDAARADDIQRSIANTVGKGLWQGVLVPLLMRPVWLCPLALGLISIGGAVSTRTQATPRTKHRRS